MGCGTSGYVEEDDVEKKDSNDCKPTLKEKKKETEAFGELDDKNKELTPPSSDGLLDEERNEKRYYESDENISILQDSNSVQIVSVKVPIAIEVERNDVVGKPPPRLNIISSPSDMMRTKSGNVPRSIEEIEDDGEGEYDENNNYLSPDLEIIGDNFTNVIRTLSRKGVIIDDFFNPLEDLVDSLLEINFACKGFTKVYGWVTTLGARDSSMLLTAVEKDEIAADVDNIQKVFNEQASRRSAKSPGTKSRMKANIIFSFTSLLTSLNDGDITIGDVKEGIRDILIGLDSVKELLSEQNIRDVKRMKRWRNYFKQFESEQGVQEDDIDRLLDDFEKMNDGVTRTFETI